ncbi:MAG: hypothetical protein IT214_05155 [Chitinophagaceae bacterium]|jgi:hypothetical protein|nr:hypothetical protein [Chitinophagaceae bacterium]OQY96511.1 MAG: hypothetical protein B6D37_01820 [Sphingobacteriales bacterium UTBCD1]
MQKGWIYLIITLLSVPALSQQVVTLEENIPYANNGMEYGFYISNSSTKEVKGVDYDRYELNFYVANKSGCLKLIPFSNRDSTTGRSNEIQVAEFNCLNATGKRLTSKKGVVSARVWYTYVRIPDEQAKNKYRMANAEAGYAISNGQTITSRIIVIVPKDEKPKVNCRIIYFPEFQ